VGTNRSKRGASMKLFTWTAWWVGFALLLFAPVAKSAMTSSYNGGFIQLLPTTRPAKVQTELSPLRLELMEKQSGVVARIIFTGQQDTFEVGEELQTSTGRYVHAHAQWSCHSPGILHRDNSCYREKESRSTRCQAVSICWPVSCITVWEQSIKPRCHLF
jgi:hypothetical protein